MRFFTWDVMEPKNPGKNRTRSASSPTWRMAVTAASFISVNWRCRIQETQKLRILGFPPHLEKLSYRSLPLQSRECGFRMCSDGPHWPQASLAPRSIDLAIPTYFYWKIPILVVLNLVVFVCCSIVCLLFIVNVFSDGPHCPPALSLATRPGPLVIIYRT